MGLINRVFASIKCMVIIVVFFSFFFFWWCFSFKNNYITILENVNRDPGKPGLKGQALDNERTRRSIPYH